MVIEAPSRPPVPPSVIEDQHQGSKSDFGGEVDIEEAIDRSGCSLEYYRLEECLGEHDRDWRRCQAQTSCGLLVPIPQGDVVAASDTRLRRVPEPVPATPPATSTPAVIPPASGIKVGDGGGDGTDDVLLRAVRPSSTEFVKFVKRRKAAQGSVVLDLRPNTDFDRREHFVGATSIPADELEARLLELPPPFAQPLSIKGNEEDLRESSDFLTSEGRRIVAEIVAGMVTGGRAEWPTEVGSRSVQVWRANGFLEFCMEHFLLPSTLDGSGTAEEVIVLDLGCGSGRDTAHMAQHLSPGTRVIGVDNHSYALKRGERVAEQWVDAADGGGTAAANSPDGSESHGESARDGPGDGHGSLNRGRARKCEWLLADLRKKGSLKGLMASVIHGHRFMCEQLLPLLRDDVSYSPRNLHGPGELADIFSGEDFETLVDEQGELSTRGSVVSANFLACRKRPSVQSSTL